MSEPLPDFEHCQQERDLRAGLDRARAEYERAKRDYDAAIELYHALPSGHPDSNFKIRQALHQKSRALSDYCKALKEFTAAVTSGRRQG